MSQELITEAVIEKLKTAPLLWDGIGGRGYHLYVPRGTAKPHLLVSLPSDQVQSYFEAGEDHHVKFQITLAGSLDEGFGVLASYQAMLMTMLHRKTWRLDSRHTLSIWAVAHKEPQVDDPVVRIESQWEARLVS